MSFSEVITCLDFVHEPTMPLPRKDTNGPLPLVHKNTFAWFSVNLVIDKLLNKEEQHYNNSWQMLFPPTFRFLKPLQKHMQKVICLSVDVWFQAGCSDTTAYQFTGDILASSKCTQTTNDRKTFSGTTWLSTYKTNSCKVAPVH